MCLTHIFESSPCPEYGAKSVLPKAELRRRLLAARCALLQDTAGAFSERIQAQVCSLSIWRAARSVALYIAVHHEVSTENLLDTAWNEGKTVCLPRCLPPENGEGIMEFAVCSCRDKLVPASFGLWEPDASCPPARVPPDLMLIPAVGISPTGARLGYGKGFYDRLLARPGWCQVPRIALAYGFQVVAFSATPQDMPMNACVTEKEIICF